MNYKNYAEKCRQVLAANKPFFLTNVSLFPVKNHPGLTEHLEMLRSRQLMFYSYLAGIVFKNILLFFFHLVRSKTPSLKPVNANNLILSHAVNSPDKKTHDRYFGNLATELTQRNLGCSSLVYISHNGTYSTDQNFIGQNLSLNDNLRFFLTALKSSSHVLLQNSQCVPFRFRALVAACFFSNATRRSYVITNVILQLLYNSNVNRIFITCEGHSWERYLLYKLKEEFPQVVSISYAHGLILDSQYPIGWKFAYPSQADIYFVAGPRSAKLLREFGLENVHNLGRLGAQRNSRQGSAKRERFYSGITSSSITIALDGELVEILAGLKIGCCLAQLLPMSLVKIRPHPDSLRNKTSLNVLNRYTKEIRNMELDTKPLTVAFDNVNYVLYRGSTVICDAVKSGAIPICWGTNPLEIDPLCGTGIVVEFCSSLPLRSNLLRLIDRADEFLWDADFQKNVDESADSVFSVYDTKMLSVIRDVRENNN